MKKILVLIAGIFLVHCSDTNSPLNCATVLCTEEYITIVTTLKYEDGSPVLLDNFKVMALDSGRDLTIDVSDDQGQYLRDHGIYPIFSDVYRSDYLNDVVRIEFSGYINEQEVVNEQYTVGANCCHVYLKGGATDLIIE